MSDARGSSSRSDLARLVQRHDRDRFLTALFAPEPQRAALLALYAFNYEVAKTREIVSEPALGRIRLQFWRDSLESVYAGAPPRRHEVIEPLAAAIRARGLTRDYFERLLTARERDLADEPPEDLAALEAYAEASSAPLVLLALETLGATDQASLAAGRAVGTAYALSGLLRAVPFHARAKRLYLPRDLCTAAGLEIERGLFELRAPPRLRQVLAPVAERASFHLATARALRRQVPRLALPALLPAVLAQADLARLKRAGYDPFAPAVAGVDPWRGWRLYIAALRRRY